MDIGDYATNVVTINDFKSIHYVSYESDTRTALGARELCEIEETIRSAGALVIKELKYSSLWIFGQPARIEKVLEPWTSGVNQDNIEVEGHKLRQRIKAAYDPAKVLRHGRQNSVSSISMVLSKPKPEDATTTPIAQARNHNVGAVANNAMSSMDGIIVQRSGGSPVSHERHWESGIVVHELFISAILASLTHGLCASAGMLQINARTLTRLPKKNEVLQYSGRDELVTVNVDVHMTSSGSLTLKVSARIVRGLGCLADQSVQRLTTVPMTEGSVVFLGPSGQLACFQKFEDEGTSSDGASSNLSGTPKEQTSTTMRWRSCCLRSLKRRGLGKDVTSAGWAIFRIPQDTLSDCPSQDVESQPHLNASWISVSWPVSLCFFQKSDVDAAPDTLAPVELRDDNPLSLAISWIESQSERETLLAERHKPAEVVSGEVPISNLQTPGSYELESTARRGSLNANVYPTPPDNIQQTQGTTPSLEGNPATSPPDFVQQGSEVVESPVQKEKVDSTDAAWESNTARQDAVSTSLEFVGSSHDNLFGDMDAELFGGNDVTDADFSFFDEPDMLDHEAANVVAETSVDRQEEGSEDGEQLIGHDENNAFSPDHDQDVEEENMLVLNLPQPEQVEGLLRTVESQTLSGNPPMAVVDVDSAPEIDIFTNKIMDPPPKQSIPLLSPEEVFRRLSTLRLGHLEPKDPMFGTFKRLNFDTSISLFGDKYGVRGRFDLPLTSRAMTRTPVTSLPQTEYLTKRRKRRGRTIDARSTDHESTPKQTPNSFIQSSPDHADSILDSDADSAMSDQDDTSSTSEDGPATHLRYSKRQRRESHEEVVNVPTLFPEGDASPETLVDTPHPVGDLCEVLADSDAATWPLDTLFASSKPVSKATDLDDNQVIATAQLLTDLALSRMLQIPGLEDSAGFESSLPDPFRERSFLQEMHTNLATTASSYFDKVTQCSLNTYLDIQDMANISQVNRLPPRPNMPARAGNTPEAPKSIYSIPFPHLEVTRADGRLSVMPSAVSFWESAGFGPRGGAKSVHAICACPVGAGVDQTTRDFVDQIGTAFEALHFGSHKLFEHDSLLYTTHSRKLYEYEETLVEETTQADLQETVIQLGSMLTASTIKNTNFVVYFVYDPKKPEVLPSICASFSSLYELYRASFATAKTEVSNEIILQLVPLDFVVSEVSWVSLLSESSTNLAMEIYDRCVDTQQGRRSAAIVLEKPLPRMIEFKLTPEPSSSVMQENSVIHIAYAQSVDQRWITAAWTDSVGIDQYTASYCLGRQGTVLTSSLSCVITEIWESTLDIIEERKVNWRIMVVRCGVLQPFESELWKRLASTVTTAQVSLTLLAVDSRPALQLIAPAISFPATTLQSQAGLNTTPISTPQALALSPDPPGTTPSSTPYGATASATTPNDSQPEFRLEPDAILVDVREQCWGAILSHRLNNSHSLLDHQPALASGYLIKRSGAMAIDAPVVLQVNLVHSEVNPRLYEALLREVLGLYRGLGTLARARGNTDPARDARPWHVAAAEKAVEVLYMLL